jgi:hypothetical protein
VARACGRLAGGIAVDEDRPAWRLCLESPSPRPQRKFALVVTRLPSRPILPWEAGKPVLTSRTAQSVRGMRFDPDTTPQHVPVCGRPAVHEPGRSDECAAYRRAEALRTKTPAAIPPPARIAYAAPRSQLETSTSAARLTQTPRATAARSAHHRPTTTPTRNPPTMPMRYAVRKSFASRFEKPS